MPTTNINLDINLGSGTTEYLTKAFETDVNGAILKLANSYAYQSNNQFIVQTPNADDSLIYLNQASSDGSQYGYFILGGNVPNLLHIGLGDSNTGNNFRILKNVNINSMWIGYDLSGTFTSGFNFIPEDIVITSPNINPNRVAAFYLTSSGTTIRNTNVEVDQLEVLSTSGQGTSSGYVLTTNGSGVTSWQPSSSGGTFSSPLTTKGDIYTYSSTDARLGIGANATMLMADSSVATGNKWVAFSGDATIDTGGTITLANTAVSADNYGSASQIPVFSIDSKGRVTSASTVSISSQSITGQALSGVNDTNVTISLSGNPNTALLSATTINLGWTGTLSGSRGGTGVNNGSNTITLGGNLTTQGAFNTVFNVTSGGTYTLPISSGILLANNVGVSTGTTLVGGTGSTGSIIFQDTSNTTNSLNTNHFVWKMTTAAGVLEESLRMGNATGGEMNLYSMGNTTQYWLRSTLNASYFNAASDLRLQVAGANLLLGSTTQLTLSKNVLIAPAMKLTLAAGTTTVQPLLYQNGSLLTTPIQFSSEVSSEGQLFYTPAASQRNFVGLWGYTAKSANYTATTTDYTIDCTGNTFSVTLPTAGASVNGVPAGRIYKIINSGAGVITINTTSSQTINGGATKTLTTQYSGVELQSTGSNWIITSQF